MEVRQAVKSRLNQEELWKYLLEGVLNYLKESSFSPPDQGQTGPLQLVLAVSLLGREIGCHQVLRSCKGLVRTKGVFLDNSFSKGLIRCGPGVLITGKVGRLGLAER